MVAFIQGHDSYQEGNMTPEARRMLDLLDAWFVSDNVSPMEKGELWDVLTALRGPDKLEDSKRDTTIPIRRAAFPILAQSHRRFDLTAAFGYGYYTYNGPVQGSPVHFDYHVYQAARALGLIKEPVTNG